MKKTGREEKEDKKNKRTDIATQLQITEQSLQNLLLQKQLFQLEFIETNSALEELKKTKAEDVYKIVGSLMFKSNKEDLEKELERKKDILDLRLKAIEKQEEELKEKLIKSRETLLKEMKD